jgi:hypothetical protein
MKERVRRDKSNAACGETVDTCFRCRRIASRRRLSFNRHPNSGHAGKRILAKA